jgi:hypothetical protein
VIALRLPPDFYLKEARFDQTDVLNQPLKFTGSVPTPLDILISPKGGRIEGVVLNDKEGGIADYVANIEVVLIPNQQRERTDLYRTAMTDKTGRFTISGIPPGSYKAFAWEFIEPFAYFDSDLLRRFEAQGEDVQISESGRENLKVRLIPDPGSRRD